MGSEEIYLQNVKNYKKVFDSEAGQKVLWDLMKVSSFISDGFDKDPGQMAYNSGAKSMVSRLLGILEMDEANLASMVAEQRKADKNERRHFNVTGDS